MRTESEALELAGRVKIDTEAMPYLEKYAVPGVVNVPGGKSYIVHSDGHGLVAVAFEPAPDRPNTTPPFPSAKNVAGWLAEGPRTFGPGLREMVSADGFRDWIKACATECPECGTPRVYYGGLRAYTRIAGWVKHRLIDRGILAQFVLPMLEGGVGGLLYLGAPSQDGMSPLLIESPLGWSVLVMPLRPEVAFDDDLRGREIPSFGTEAVLGAPVKQKTGE